MSLGKPNPIVCRNMQWAWPVFIRLHLFLLKCVGQTRCWTHQARLYSFTASERPPLRTGERWHLVRGNLVWDICAFVPSKAGLTKEVVFHEGGHSKEVLLYMDAVKLG